MNSQIHNRYFFYHKIINSVWIFASLPSRNIWIGFYLHFLSISCCPLRPFRSLLLFLLLHSVWILNRLYIGIVAKRKYVLCGKNGFFRFSKIKFLPILPREPIVFFSSLFEVNANESKTHEFSVYINALNTIQQYHLNLILLHHTFSFHSFFPFHFLSLSLVLSLFPVIH